MKTTMKSMAGFTFACIFLIPMLVACGGGGGGGSAGISGDSSPPDNMPESADMSSSHGTPNLSHIAWLVDPGAARQAVNGAVALSLTSNQGLNQINAITAKSNNINASRLWYKEQGESAIHGAFGCTTGGCRIGSGEPPPIDVQISKGLSLNKPTLELQPVMSHNGVSIGQVRATTVSAEVQLYGGWMENSAFFVRWISHPDFNAAFPHAFGYTHFLREMGNFYRDNPQDLALSGSGLKATWTGAAVGIRYGSGHEGNVVHGTSLIAITDFTSATMDVSLASLYDLDEGTELDNMVWRDLTITEGGFSSGAANSGNQIHGRFYGENHTEVVGTFDRNSITGAFGAIRDRAGQ